MTWHLAAIDSATERTLDAWMAFEVPFDGPDRPWTWHLVGWRLEGGRGQVSSPVVQLDPVARKAVTRSGRVYELGKRPGLNPDAFATWSAWKRRHGLRDEREVTSELEEVLLAGVR
ncbi:hypothetical protein RAMLITH_17490 [Ramlibacter sp. RBP-2]|uniref:Uncharacterized protein n=1 Tax=Ramlibacter lithotrophicus TaxID=2606681 RepID=A0A7X6DI58_9BURK|nr:hypothetical protein [Ramlibacter lithotrophicus]NKE67619.1 hypothetical protein [Ramlibacter lithotrophicus]